MPAKRAMIAGLIMRRGVLGLMSARRGSSRRTSMLMMVRATVRTAAVGMAVSATRRSTVLPGGQIMPMRMRQRRNEHIAGHHGQAKDRGCLKVARLHPVIAPGRSIA
jgi:hypothetical protein